MNPIMNSQELQELSDGEILDLVYKIMSDDNLDETQKLETIQIILEDSKTY
jgi:hypothetical protein